ncbi:MULTISPECIES: helix-turn-helix transcriptional regulator [unclassified Nocardioides]|uniref:helix-turn-helix transcriptional regulator n=1 Tax=unclassified Nocardioides TaxID=2615069 RepID=UPI00361E29B3
MADEVTMRAGMRRVRSHAPISGVDIQVVQDAAATLQVRRADLAARVSAGADVGAELMAVGLTEINDWLFDMSAGATDMLSANMAGYPDQLQQSLPVNRTRLANGLKMISLWDFWRTDYEAKVLLANESVGTYLFGVVPVTMKIIDRRYVLLPGPVTAGDISMMKVWDPACLEAAWRYWRTAMAHTIPFRPRSPDDTGLTARQHQIMTLLAADLSDDAVAAALEISIRTVRSEVARVLSSLGVKSRFAAGVRLDLWDEGPGG